MYISNAETIEFRIESEIKEDKVHYIVKGGFDGIPIGAVQLQLKYNKDKLQLSNNTFQTGGTDFINDQNGIISFGSLKIDDVNCASLVKIYLGDEASFPFAILVPN